MTALDDFRGLIDADWLVTRGGGSLHHTSDLSDVSESEAEDCYLDPETVAKLDCGRTYSGLSIPGVFSRGAFGGGLPRCRKCCQVNGLPAGLGSPKNDPECRAILGMDVTT